ncbi:hypothetical protein PRIPAC_74062 [Pristionchus pacificus]|uniref:Uncharacterized protein n=1 Tax=Pristionchus pacificus TaxID=54126 RepID=A0A8R1Z103_PRIPA|nr:hypothetical protein PRIPAC_74062 [Pristionchus pacificus]|eukprot:PDM76784.1 hypothetical protein PRIPAC_42179 [Pristionchus pacificus]
MLRSFALLFSSTLAPASSQFEYEELCEYDLDPILELADEALPGVFSQFSLNEMLSTNKLLSFGAKDATTGQLLGFVSVAPNAKRYLMPEQREGDVGRLLKYYGKAALINVIFVRKSHRNRPRSHRARCGGAENAQKAGLSAPHHVPLRQHCRRRCLPSHGIRALFHRAGGPLPAVGLRAVQRDVRSCHEENVGFAHPRVYGSILMDDWTRLQPTLPSPSWLHLRSTVIFISALCRSFIYR